MCVYFGNFQGWAIPVPPSKTETATRAPDRASAFLGRVCVVSLKDSDLLSIDAAENNIEIWRMYERSLLGTGGMPDLKDEERNGRASGIDVTTYHT